MKPCPSRMRMTTQLSAEESKRTMRVTLMPKIKRLHRKS